MFLIKFWSLNNNISHMAETFLQFRYWKMELILIKVKMEAKKSFCPLIQNSFWWSYIEALSHKMFQPTNIREGGE